MILLLFNLIIIIHQFIKAVVVSLDPAFVPLLAPPLALNVLTLLTHLNRQLVTGTL